MELRSCYFCGSTGAALETRELAPDRLVPDADPSGADEPISVVLCPACRTKLDRLLDGVFGSGRREPDRDPPAAGTADDRSSAFDFSSEITFADAAGVDDPDAAGVDDPDAAGVDDAGVDGSDGPAADGDADGAADPDAAGADDLGDPDAGGSAADADDAREARDDGETGSSGTLRGLGEGSTNSYRQALRLLQNREFPMARADLVDVMSSAYDLDPGECERLVDLAVDRDWLVEEGGELRRG